MNQEPYYKKLDFEVYKRFVERFARLSKLFSDSETAYIPYRYPEKLVVHCQKGQDVRDLSRKDNSFDAMDIVSKAGIGVKTYVGGNPNQSYKVEKVAEFTTLARKEKLAELEAEDLAYKISHLRNSRIQSDAAEFGIDLTKSFYHCLIRKPGYAFVHEEPYPLVDLKTITPIHVKAGKSQTLASFGNDKTKDVFFSDSANIYKYSRSKNVLYKLFDEKAGYNSANIITTIEDDPFSLLLNFLQDKPRSNFVLVQKQKDSRQYVVLPLVAARTAKGDYPEVPERSGINQWNALGRERKFGEAYIPVPASVKKWVPDFFPVLEDGGKLIGQNFRLTLPDGTIINASLCQENLKALMSNPNDDLVKWLFAMIDGSYMKALQRYDGHGSCKNRPYTYADLLRINKDSVLIAKNSDESFELIVLPVGGYKIFAAYAESGTLPVLEDFLDELHGDEDDAPSFDF